jgi:hypothetical protein
MNLTYILKKKKDKVAADVEDLKVSHTCCKENRFTKK